MLFSRVFRVLSDPLRDRGVDFLTVNIDEKSCYFRVFFACFLTDCKTGVLIFSCYAERRVLVYYELPKTLLKTVRDQVGGERRLRGAAGQHREGDPGPLARRAGADGGHARPRRGGDDDAGGD